MQLRVHTRSFAALIATVLLAASSAIAQVVSLPVANPGFESPAIPTGTFLTTAPPDGWGVYGNGIDFGFRTLGVLDPATTTLYAVPVPEGENVGVAFLLDDQGDQSNFAGIEAGLEQTLGVPLTTLTSYTLTVEVGNITNSPFPPNDPFEFTGFPGYRIELLAGGVPIACDDDSLLPAEGTFLTSTTTVSIGASHPLAGQMLGIRLVNLNAAPGLEVNFDDVRLEARLLPALVGQANAPLASLTINGEGPTGVPGPFYVLADGVLGFSWTGEPVALVGLLAGPLNVGNTVVPGFGSLDVGTPPTYADVGLISQGIGSPTGPGGTSDQTVILPPFLSGVVFDTQGIVFSTVPGFATFTAAFRVVVL